MSTRGPGGDGDGEGDGLGEGDGEGEGEGDGDGDGEGDGEGLGEGEGDGDGEGLGEGDGDGDGDGVVPPQLTPFTEKAAGLGLLPVHVPLKPSDSVAPLARLLFHGMFAAVTFAPLCVQLADQPWVTRWPEFGNVKPRLQLESASPVLRTVTLAVKPP
ncbi:hypothetical protein HerbRD11066_72760 [Herbidospora sp. RD11066]